MGITPVVLYLDHVLLLTIVIIIVLLLYHSLIATITFSQLVIRVSRNESIVGVLYCGHKSELLQLTFILLLALPTTHAGICCAENSSHTQA